MTEDEFSKIIEEKKARMEHIKSLAKDVENKKLKVIHLLEATKESKDIDFRHQAFLKISSLTEEIAEVEKDLDEMRLSLIKEMNRIMYKVEIDIFKDNMKKEKKS
jgi:hypothetical protein